MKRSAILSSAALFLTLGIVSASAAAASAEESYEEFETKPVAVETYDDGYSYDLFDYCYSELNEYSYAYTGSAITPSVSVYNYYTESYLTEGTDFTVTPDSDPNAGYKTATIVGKGKYAGQTMTTDYYYIEQEDISYNTTVMTSNCTYTGSRPTPTVTVVHNGKALTEGTDYTVTFSCDYWGEYDAGTYSAEIEGIGNYCGYKSKDFQITPKDASDATVPLVVGQIYRGYSVCPTPAVTLDGKTLTLYQDYDIEYVNNDKPGRGKATIKFYGNYTGKKIFTYMIGLPKPTGFTVYAAEKSADFYWDYIDGALGYKIYQYNPKTRNYYVAATTSDTYYHFTGLNSLTQYKFKVRAYYKCGTATRYSTYSDVKSFYTLPPKTTITLNTGEKSCLVAWKSVANVDGYEVLQDSGSGFKRYKLFGKSDVKAYITGLSNDIDYSYAVRTYKKVGSTTLYSDYSNILGTQNNQSRFNGLTKGSASRSYKIYNVQGSKTTTSTGYISDSEWKLVQNFAKTYFKSGMSNYQKAMTAYDYIVKNTKYQYDYSKIQWDKPVYQVLVKHEAQCDGYNGAFLAIMRYLGYDINLIQGSVNLSSGSVGQHFWCTIKRGTQNYIFDTNMETYWPGTTHYFFCAKYSDPNSYKRYIINKVSRTK